MDSFANFDWLLNETNFKGLAHLFLILYAAKLAPALPDNILAIFNNGYVKLLVYVVILYTSNVNPTTALLIAIAFMVTMNVVNNKKLFEMMENEVAPIAEVPDVKAVFATEAPVAEAAAAEAVVAPVAAVPVATAVASSGALINEAPVLATVSPTLSVSELQTPTPVKGQVAEPAMTPAAQMAEVPAEVQAELPCFPERKYDMEKVQPVAAFDNYSEFLLSV